MTTTNNSDTNATILAAAMLGGGNYYATRCALGRFCTEALIDCAARTEVPVKFAIVQVPTWRSLTREESTERLCGWASWQKLQAKYQAARAAAIAELPEALTELGAAL